MKKVKGQMSESLVLGLLLALAGGFFDAYTYLCRGGVFANAETGNIVLLGAHLAEGDLEKALRYLLPIVAFAFGVLSAELVKRRFKSRQNRDINIHWRQIVVLGRPAAAVRERHGQHHHLVRLRHAGRDLPQGARQRLRDHHVHGQSAFGNRAACHLAADGRPRRREKNEELLFILGGAIGALVTNAVGEKALLLTLVPLAAVFLIMFIEEEREELEEEISGGRA